MATRFYLLNETAPYTPASWQGGWDLDGTITRACDPFKFGSTTTTATRAETSATNPFKVGVLRVVSRRLAPQTISGTVDMVVGLTESNVAADFFTRLHLYVINSTDGSVLGTLLNGYTESAAGGATEWPTTNTGTALQGAQALSSVTVPNDGDDYRIVAELGYSSENAVITSRTGTIRYGARPGSVTPALSDLTAGSTSTTTLAGFLEFSGTVSLASDVVTHLTPEDAFVIGPTLPDTDALRVDDGGYTYTVWGTYAGQVGVNVIGVWPFGDLVTYKPVASVFVGDGASLALPYTGGTNIPLQFPTALGTNYYLRIVSNAGNPTPANLTVSAQAAPASTDLGGALFVPDDTKSIAAILSVTQDYTVLGFRDFPPGEAGDIIESSGVMAMQNSNTSVDVYDGTFTRLSQVAMNAESLYGSVRANPTLNKFVALSLTPNPDQVKLILPDGTVPTTYTITGLDDILVIAINNAGTILYYATQTGDTAAIKRWDLAGGAGLSELINLGTTTKIVDMHVLVDDTVLASFVNFSTGVIVRRYDTSGTLLQTFDYADSDELFPSGTPPRIARANDDPDSFWLWRHQSSEAGISRFRNIRISDGTVLTNRAHVEFESGSYDLTASETPLSRFGTSFSCPFWILPGVPTPVITPPDSEVTGGTDESGNPRPLSGSYTRELPCIHGSYTRSTALLRGSYTRAHPTLKGST